MTKILVVGSSHVASLKAGYDADPSAFDGHEVEFFVSHVNYTRLLRIDKSGVLFAPHPHFKHPDVGQPVGPHLQRLNGKETCDLTKADVIVWSGFRANERFNLTPCYHVYHLLHYFDVEGLRESGNPRTLSKKAFDVLLAEEARNHTIPKLWRSPVLPRVVGLMTPAPTGNLKHFEKGLLFRIRELQHNPEGCAEALSQFFDEIEAVLAEQDVTLVRQPQASMDSMGLTDRYYNDAPVGIAVDQPALDPVHMNAHYGRLALETVLEHIAQTS